MSDAHALLLLVMRPFDILANTGKGDRSHGRVMLLNLAGCIARTS
ncbi:MULTISPECIES: hypothetical protein [unclassified Leptolyngbya]|nr:MULTISPECIES: hypothetical protein [unclassified Leptolyngbya]